MLMCVTLQIYPTESASAGYLASTSSSAVHMSNGITVSIYYMFVSLYV